MATEIYRNGKSASETLVEARVMNNKKSNNQSGVVNLILLIEITIAAGIMLFGFIFQAEWARNFMIGVGMIKPMHTQVDYYSYVKGIEYLLCFYFFLIFPVFFMFVNNKKN
jgi:hypothetical protein